MTSLWKKSCRSTERIWFHRKLFFESEDSLPSDITKMPLNLPSENHTNVKFDRDIHNVIDLSPLVYPKWSYPSASCIYHPDGYPRSRVIFPKRANVRSLNSLRCEIFEFEVYTGLGEHIFLWHWRRRIKRSLFGK